MSIYEPDRAELAPKAFLVPSHLRHDRARTLKRHAHAGAKSPGRSQSASRQPLDARLQRRISAPRAERASAFRDAEVSV